ncbi:hypothetical protein BBJ28_00004945 [Nothophytophthora sp. Chile5]|nr:hypothetical protein BBJ28_00004945 [Nothophytophthora sp. Chile5]
MLAASRLAASSSTRLRWPAAAAAGAVVIHPVLSPHLHVHCALFSSKRRPRYGDEEVSVGGRRGKKEPLSFASQKQKQQLNKLKEMLVQEDLARLPVPITVDAATTDKDALSAAGFSSTSDRAGKKRQKEFARMLRQKEARQQRVKHLPLFRQESPLLRQYGERTLGDYENLPRTFFDGDIAVIHSAQEEEPHAEYLREQKVVHHFRDCNWQCFGFDSELFCACWVVGVDTEARPDFHPLKGKEGNPVCLIQVSTLERAFIYRLQRGEALPSALQELFADPDVLKVGHSLSDDFRQLKAAKLVQAVNSTVDTLYIAHKLGCLRPGLKTACQVFLGGSISKEMQVSDWEAPVLSEEQISYAATDAWAPLRVLLAMIQLKDTKALLRTKSYNASAQTVVDEDGDKLLGLLHAFALRHHVPSLEQQDQAAAAVSE